MDDILVYETRFQPTPELRDKRRRLYVISKIETGEDGKPFALCGYHFDRWEAKDRVFWRVIGEDTSEPCNQCNRTEEGD